MKKDINQIFRDTTIRFCANHNLEDALNECRRYLQTILPMNMMYIGVIDSHSQGARIIACVNEKGPVPVDDSWVIPFSEADIREAAKRFSDGICLMQDGHEFQPVRIGAEIMGIRGSFSVMNLRLPLEEELLGFIGMIAGDAGQYTDEHAGVLRPLVPVFAHGLSYAIRYRDVLRLIKNAREDIRFLQKDLKRLTGEVVIGSGTGLKGVMTAVRKAVSKDSPILLLGETGVGKGVVANAIHSLSDRKDAPFIRVPCGQVAGSLLFDELFGHEQGAFTGADCDKRGSFERAGGGYLFLEDIGKLPLDVQTVIAKVLTEKTFGRFGGTRSIPADVRLIVSTHQNLGRKVHEGVFLEDLWRLINHSPIVVPPLRARKLDIPLLVSHFVHLKSIEMNLPVIPSVADGEMEKLLAYDWPGNVRELENTVERALLFSQGKLLRFSDLGGFRLLSASGSNSGKPGKIPTLDEVMIQHIRRTLEKTGGRIEGKGGAAELLGIHYNTLRARMRKLGIAFGRDA